MPMRKRAKRLQGRVNRGVPQHMGQQAGHQRAAARLEELGTPVLRAAGRSVAADPAHDGEDIRRGERRVDVDPVEHVEADRIAQAELVDGVTHLRAGIRQHGAKLAGRIEDNDGAGPGQQRRHGRGGFERAGPGENQAVGRAGLAGINQQRGLAPLPPARLVRRVEGHRGDPVLIHPIRFPDHDAAESGRGSGEDFARFVDRQPIGVTVIVGRATDRLRRAAEQLPPERRSDDAAAKQQRGEEDQHGDRRRPGADLQPERHHGVRRRIEEVDPPLIERDGQTTRSGACRTGTPGTR